MRVREVHDEPRGAITVVDALVGAPHGARWKPGKPGSPAGRFATVVTDEGIVVFADVVCPFAHVGLRRLHAERARRGRAGAVLHVRAWPLELVNEAPVDGDLIAEEVADLRRDVSPDLFARFDPARFPVTSLPALALTSAAYSQSPAQGETVAFALRDALFEQGRDIADAAVLTAIATSVGVPRPSDLDQVRAEYAEGRRRGVVGSPHFFVGGHSRFCPTLDITRTDGRLAVAVDEDAFRALANDCFA